jgi:multiple sugar transport system substrate-binding protein
MGRRFTRQQFLLMSAGAGAALTLAGCGGGGPQNNPAAQGGNQQTLKRTYDGPNVEISFWNGFTGGSAPQVLPKMMQQFNSEHDNIKASNNTMEWADYFQKVPSAVAAGRGPDVGVMHETEISTYAAQNVIVPVDNVVQALGLNASDFSPAVFDAALYNGKRYGVPFSITPLGFYYNKGVMQKAGLDPNKPPQNNDEYMSAVEEMKGKGIQGSWVSPFPFTGVFQFQSLLWQFGGEMYNQDGTKATFNEDPGVQALTWMVDLIKKGYSPKNVGQDADVTAFQNSKNAFNWNGVWQTSNFDGTPDLEWGATPVPVIGDRRKAWSSSTHFVVMRQRSQDENKLQAAAVFIDWFIKNSLEWAKVGELPASNAVREQPGFKKLTLLQPFAESLPDVHFGTTIPGGADPNGPDAQMATAVNEAVLLRKSPKEALDEAARKADQALEENRQKYES